MTTAIDILKNRKKNLLIDAESFKQLAEKCRSDVVDYENQSIKAKKDAEDISNAIATLGGTP